SGAVRFADLELVAHRGDLERRRLVVDAPLPAGYHRLTVAAHGAAPRAAALIVVPERCWLPEPIVRGERVWGLTTQLYGLRSARNWGIGDFTDLAELARIAGRLGADTIGLNPLHAAFPRSLATPSPYSPASRLDRKSTRLNSSHVKNSYGVFCLKKKKTSFGLAIIRSGLRLF